MNRRALLTNVIAGFMAICGVKQLLSRNKPLLPVYGICYLDKKGERARLLAGKPVGDDHTKWKLWATHDIDYALLHAEHNNRIAMKYGNPSDEFVYRLSDKEIAKAVIYG